MNNTTLHGFSIDYEYTDGNDIFYTPNASLYVSEHFWLLSDKTAAYVDGFFAS
jgi:hypothetical protein